MAEPAPNKRHVWETWYAMGPSVYIFITYNWEGQARCKVSPRESRISSAPCYPDQFNSVTKPHLKCGIKTTNQPNNWQPHLPGRWLIVRGNTMTLGGADLLYAGTITKYIRMLTDGLLKGILGKDNVQRFELLSVALAGELEWGRRGSLPWARPAAPPQRLLIRLL